jgi:hypothetical protein
LWDNRRTEKMYRYLPSETIDNKFVVDIKNHWLSSPVLEALNKATEVVLESSASSFYKFPSTCFEELKKSRQIRKEQGFSLRYLNVDNILGRNFECTLSDYIEIVHSCMYDDTSNVLYKLYRFMDSFETQREYHEDKELKYRKEIGIIKGRRMLRELIDEKVSEVVEDHSDKKDFLIRKIELSEIIERHFYHILINLTKLSFANTLKDYSTCVQELLVLISAIMDVSLKEKKVLSLNSVGED